MAFKPEAQLRIPTVPNFPFSSPISEEISSPAASSEDDKDLERNRPFKLLTKASSQSPFIQHAIYSGERRDQTDAISNEERDPQTNIQNPERPVRPDRPVGLNLVTDFSLSTRNEPAPPVFVDLNDLKALSKARDQERSTQKIKGILKKGAAKGFHRLPDDPPEPGNRRLSWLSSKNKSLLPKKCKDELSPSDRPIMIGISVPFGESLETQETKSKELDSATSQHTPLTPTIIVTPAKEKDDGFWLAPDYHRPRATSSIYSQPTPYLEHRGSEIPPVPAIPVFHSIVKSDSPKPDLFRRESTASTRKRSYSTGTVFEEDDDPQSRRSRSYSSGSAKKDLNRLSVVTDASRQPSGWWTYLLSPLLTRSPTVASRKPPTRTERPPMPTIVTSSTRSSDEWWEKETEKEMSYFSPDTPETAGVNRGETFNAGSNPFADVNPRSYDQSRNMGEQGAMSFMFSGGTIQGAAAEYYQACAHELFSGKPYFECVNHVCSITPKDKIPVLPPDAAADSTSRGRNLLVEVDDDDHDDDDIIDDEEELPKPGPIESRGASSALGARTFSGATAVDDRPNSPFYKKKELDTPGDIEASKGDPPLPVAKDTAETSNPSEKHCTTWFHQTSTNSPPVTHIYYQAPQHRPIPKYIVVSPPNYGGQPQPPDPTSPGLQRATERSGSIPLSNMATDPLPAYTSPRASPALPPRIAPVPVTRGELRHPLAQAERIEGRRRRLEKEDRVGKKAGGLWRGRGCFSSKGCFGRPGREGRLRRRWYFIIVLLFLLIVAGSLALALTLTRKGGDETPVQSQWLNLTGYPPMPTGIATIAGPEPQVQNSGCIVPSTLWSCALPPEQHSANAPYAANEPNFRVEVQFVNGTYPNSTTVASKTRRDASAVSSPSPSPPSINDQTFLGNTTDGNALPYAGEVTPFYMTVLSTTSVSTSRLIRRSTNDSFPNIESLIPSPDVNSDGTAAAANLYPLPIAQPVRLYNRGLATEHYGFYTYFDRSIFLESTAPVTDGNTDTIPADANGGSSEATAQVRCTWAQTRFLVQIWTQTGKFLIGSTNATTSSSMNSTATDFTRPGSFPYPVTITLDRHGGVAEEKMVYCYGMETGQRINSTEKKLQIENRGFDGSLVNPAPGIFNLTGTSTSFTTASEDGIDGGTGGCSCQWTNWVKQS